MAFLQDNVWVNLPAELAEWLEEMTQFWNSGRFPVHIASVPPTSSTPANGSEIRFAKDGSSWKIYVYVDATDKWQEGTLTTVA